MELQVVANQNQIVEAINDFRPSYHADFFGVRCLAKAYLTKGPLLTTANPLAVALHDVLGRWGAELREAPTRRTINEFQTALMNAQTHTLLSFFSDNPITTLNLEEGEIRTIGGVRDMAMINAFDTNLLCVLNTLANGLFINNTNVTYPMKALLLITGFMPAFDGQVRRGLGNAGFSGVNRTQFLLPRNAVRADGKKICGLPFYLAECYAIHMELISQAVNESDYPALGTEVGRIFDVLLFIQSDPMRPKLLSLLLPEERWYNFA